MLAAGIIVVVTCRPATDFGPRIETGDVSDTTQVVRALPSSVAVQISKNGYREFDLDAIVTDEDDADSTIRWSLSPGSLLNVTLYGRLAELGPLPNQVGESYVILTATDPGGLSTSKTCPVSVFDEFRTDYLPDTIAVSTNRDTTIALKCQYRASLRSKLNWGVVSYDSVYLSQCSLSGSPDSGALTLAARTSAGTTGIQFTVHDPVNHVDFNHGILVMVR